MNLVEALPEDCEGALRLRKLATRDSLNLIVGVSGSGGVERPGEGVRRSLSDDSSGIGGANLNVVELKLGAGERRREKRGRGGGFDRPPAVAGGRGGAGGTVLMEGGKSGMP